MKRDRDRDRDIRGMWNEMNRAHLRVACRKSSSVDLPPALTRAQARLVVMRLNDTHAHHLRIRILEWRWRHGLIIALALGRRVASGPPQTPGALDTHTGGSLDGGQTP